jgi:diguanylate cyclase (GGDEF)-like protein
LIKALVSANPSRIWQHLSLTQGARRNAAIALRALGAPPEQADRPPKSGTPRKRGNPATSSAAILVDDGGQPHVEQWVATRQQVAHLDSDGVVIAVNDDWQTGAAKGELLRPGLGANYLQACELSASEGSPSAARTAELTRRALAGGSNPRKFLYQQAGSWFTLDVLALPSARSGAVVVVEDITARQNLELELRHRAFHDPLTSLPNRALLTDRLEHAVAGAARETSSLAVLFIDLDDFKSVNDRLGHLAGDATLCEVARRLAECLRTSDTVGRWGGDEFVVIAERLDISVTADLLACRICERVREPMEIAGRQLVVSATVGVALLEDHETAADLVEAADRALITARRGRRPDRSRARRRTLSQSGVSAVGGAS